MFLVYLIVSTKTQVHTAELYISLYQEESSIPNAIFAKLLLEDGGCYGYYRIFLMIARRGGVNAAIITVASNLQKIQ